MAASIRLLNNFCVTTKYLRFQPIFTSAVHKLKEIRHQEVEGNVTIIEGVQVKSPRQHNLVKPKETTKACPLCRLNIHHLNYTDILIISQFVALDGKIIHQSVTGLCGRQHWKMVLLIKRAQEAGLMPMPATELPLDGWKKHHRYFGVVKEIKHYENKPLVADKKMIPVV